MLFRSLLDSEARGENPNGKIRLVVASKPGVYALERAAKAGVEGVDQMLLDAKNPQSAGNRRIEIMVLTKSASDTLYQYFGQYGDKVVQPLVQKLDKQQVLSQRTR